MVDLKDCDECITEKVCVLKHAADQRALDLTVLAINGRLTAMDKALILQAEELLRRLEELNHIKAERIIDRQTLVQKMTFDAKTDAYDKWLIAIEKRLTVQETRSILWTSMIGGAVVLLQVAMHFWR